MDWEKPEHRIYRFMDFCFIFLYIVKKWNICFTWIFLSIYLRHSSKYSHRQWATRKGGYNIWYLHKFFRGQRGFNFGDRTEPLFKTTLSDVCRSDWSVLLWCCLVFANWSTLCSSGLLSVSQTTLSPVSFAASVKSLARGLWAGQMSAQNKRQVTFCFSNGTHGFTTARCLWLMLEFSWRYVTLLSVCTACQTEANCGDLMF